MNYDEKEMIKYMDAKVRDLQRIFRRYKNGEITRDYTYNEMREVNGMLDLLIQFELVPFEARHKYLEILIELTTNL